MHTSGTLLGRRDRVGDHRIEDLGHLLRVRVDRRATVRDEQLEPDTFCLGIRLPALKQGVQKVGHRESLGQGRVGTRETHQIRDDPGCAMGLVFDLTQGLGGGLIRAVAKQ